MMTSASVPDPVRPSSTSTGSARAALIFGIAAAVLTVLGFILAMMNPGMELLVIGVWMVLLVGAVGIIGAVLAIVALVKGRRRAAALTGLVLSILSLLAVLIPFGQYLVLL